VSEQINRAILLIGLTLEALEHLVVLPEHRGQGIGSALIKSGLKEAQKINADVFIYAKTRNVYERVGCRLLDHVIQDDSKFGGTGKFAIYIYLWEYKQENADQRKSKVMEERS
jgi:predicted N-acetyltransferase YhbS